MSTTVESDTDHSDDEPVETAADPGSSSAEDPGPGGSKQGGRYRRTGDATGPVSIRSRSAEEQAGTRTGKKRPSSWDGAERRSGDDRSGQGDDRDAATTDGPEDSEASDTTGASEGLGSVSGRDEARGRRRAVRLPSGRRAGAKAGVAPWIPPEGRLGRRRRMRELTRRGFVPVSPGRRRLRHRILPRTVIGIAFMLLSVGVGAAFAGAAFYAYYDDRLAENERTVARFVDGFDQQFSDAAGALDEMRVEAVGTIRTELEPLGDFVTDASGIVGLPVSVGPSVWLVETRDEDGSPAVGSAFAVIGHRGGTALVTSYQVIRAATVEPAPGIELLKGDQRIPAELWSWDEERDLALLVVDESIPALALAGDQTQVAALGRRIFAMSGFGGQGATAAPGLLVDQSSVGLQHTAPVGTLYNGGPLVDGEGRVVGMASSTYGPLGVAPGSVAQAPDVAGLCAELLRCSEVDETVTPEVAGG